MSTAGASSGATPATPKAAAAFGATIVYIWAECFLRLWFAKGGDAVLRLWARRAGDIAGMWLAMIVVGVAAYAILAAAWKRRAAVGSLRFWTILLVASALLAPLIGEWGQTLGI